MVCYQSRLTEVSIHDTTISSSSSRLKSQSWQATQKLSCSGACVSRLSGARFSFISPVLPPLCRRVSLGSSLVSWAPSPSLCSSSIHQFLPDQPFSNRVLTGSLPHSSFCMILLFVLTLIVLILCLAGKVLHTLPPLYFFRHLGVKLCSPAILRESWVLSFLYTFTYENFRSSNAFLTLSHHRTTISHSIISFLHYVLGYSYLCTYLFLLNSLSSLKKTLLFFSLKKTLL